MDKNSKSIISGITGTLAMTLFSHWVSKASGNLFQEQKLLNIILNRSLPSKKNEVSSWLIHLLMGVGLSYLDFRLIKRSSKKASVGKGIVYGALDGLIGMAIWWLVFTVHPNPPKIPLKKFLIQLFVAHIIFGAFAAATYRELSEK